MKTLAVFLALIFSYSNLATAEDWRKRRDDFLRKPTVIPASDFGKNHTYKEEYAFYHPTTRALVEKGSIETTVTYIETGERPAYG